MSDTEFVTRAKKSVLRYGPTFFPEEIIGSDGSYVSTAGGRRILDFTSGQMSAILGHCHPEIVATVRDAAGRLDHLAGRRPALRYPESAARRAGW